MKRKKLEAICKNCALYDWERRQCKVTILHEGKKLHPPTDPSDKCIFDDQYVCVTEKGKREFWQPEIDVVKWWVENPETGDRANNGIVKIEYPEGFFGKEEENVEENTDD